MNLTRTILLLSLLAISTMSPGCRKSLAQPAPPAPPAAPTPAPIAADASNILREMNENEASARVNPELKLRALRNPLTRAKAMQFYGIEMPADAADASAPNLNQLLHTQPGDNCPVCRAREKMQAPANDL